MIEVQGFCRSLR